MRCVVVAITLVSGIAYADPETAKKLSAEAEGLVAKGDMVAAAGKFREAFREEPLPEHMCNAGVAYHKAKDLSRSHRYLHLCVTMGSSLDPGYRDNLRKVVESIERKLVAGNFTPIDVVLEPANATVTIEGGKPYDEAIVGGGRIWLPYGAYKLVVRADGYIDKRTDIAAKSDAAIPLSVKLEKEPVVEKPIEKPKPTYVDGARPSKVPAIVVTTLTAGVGAAALFMYLRARGNVDDAESMSITRDRYEELKDEAKSNQQISWALAGVAGVGAVVSGYLWYRAFKTPARVEVTPTGSGIAIRGQF